MPTYYTTRPGNVNDPTIWERVPETARCQACNVEWIRSIVKQCKDVGVPVFVKQLGGNPRWSPQSGPCGSWPDSVRFDYERRFEESQHRIILRDPKGGDPSEWPADLRVREVPTGGRDA
jgi:hypothetical protein